MLLGETFVPTAGQAQALRAFREFLAISEPGVFTLCGYAGTGKSTLVRYLVAELPGGLAATRVVAPTAKAASVLRRKGFPAATTVHKMFYRAVHCVDPFVHGFECECSKTEIWVFTPPDLRGVQLIVVDEASMVSQKMAEELCSLSVKILAIGDKFQLPPVGGGNSLLSMNAPDAELTEVTRQALDSPVLWLATEIREKRRLPRGHFADSLVTDHGLNIPRMDYEQMPIIVRRNRTRHDINTSTRATLGRSNWEPKSGDRVIGRRNDYSAGVINGDMYRVIGDPRITGEEWLSVTIDDDDRDVSGLTERTVRAWTDLFKWSEKHAEFDKMDGRTKRHAQELHYGYCITAHSSQGSEWDSVFVLDESSTFDDKWRWLYTAVTRAASRVYVLANYRHQLGS
jgi:exodeoxyribonuclease-5